MDGLEFRILGTLEVSRDGALLPMAAARQRDVLAALLLQANRVVAADWLIEIVWGDRPPATALNTLHTLVRRLRRRLADSPAQGRELLQTRPPGYRLLVAPDRLDLSRFEDLLRRGRETAANGDPGAAAELLASALRLWRGPALADVTAERLKRVERPRLQELYLQAVERRIDADLAQARHAEVLGELRSLTAEHPLRERPYGQLMTALYRSGRQAEALETYRTLRRVLADELGVDPEPGIRQLHQAILRGDPAVASPRPVAAPAPTRQRPAQLPAEPVAFTGRDDELAHLYKTLEGTSATVVIVGMAGVGKTALALHWAHRVRDQFPDGQLYVDLYGYTTAAAPLRPLDCLGQFLRALGVPPERVPADQQEAAGFYRSLVADRRILLVLDNAVSADQVRPLLPGGAGCLTVVTSRDRLDGLVARDGAGRLPLEVLVPDQAVTLLRHTIEADRLAGQPEAVVELARQCDYLPLALRIAAANLSVRRISVADYAHQMRTHGGLAELAVDGDEPTAVRGAFALSYGSQTHEARRLFRLLGLYPGTEVAAESAAALAGVAPAQAHRLLAALAAAHLLYEVTPGRYRCHDLLREYATELARAESEVDRKAALTGLYEWYLAMVDAAARLLYPELLRLPWPIPPARTHPGWADAAAALGWLEQERRNLVLAVSHAATHGLRREAYRLADALRGFFQLRRQVTDWQVVCEAADAAATADHDLWGRAASQLGLADYHRQQHRYQPAAEHFLRAADLARRADWPAAEATALTHLGAVYGETGRLADEVAHVEHALYTYRRIGNLEGEAACLGNLGVACFELGRLAEATDYYTQALRIDRECGARMGQAHTLNNLGEVHLEAGRLDQAEDCLTTGLALFREIGGAIGEAQALALLAELRCRTAEPDRAEALARSALEVANQAGAGSGDAYARWCEAIARNALAAVHLRAGDPQRAITEGQLALRAVRDGGNPYPEAQTLLGLAAAELALGRVDLAAASAGQALTIARDRGYRLLEERAVTMLARGRPE